MEKSGEGKFYNIFKLLAEHNFQLQVKDKLKCIKCKNVLINACQSQCGCRFCRECVDKLLMSGRDFCPGNTADCKSEHLSNVVPDHIMNIKISKLSVKCPEQMCGHECQLMEMEDHMRLCSKKPVQCPCHDIGCRDDDLVVDKISEHLQTDNYNHWTTLMGMIEELRNEVRAKENRIEGIIRQIDTWKVNLDTKIDVMADQINGKIESIKMEKAEFSGELRNLNGKLEGIRVEVDARLDETRRGYMGHVEEQLGLINETICKYQDQMAGRMGKIKTWMEKEELATFVCHVDKVSLIPFNYIRCSNNMLSSFDRPSKYGGYFRPKSRLREVFSDDEPRLSEYFSPKTNPYKIQLTINNNYSQLLINLIIHATPNDENLQWPFQARVTVKVTNEATPAASMEDTKYCNIPRPPNNNYSDNSEDPFQFPIADLSSKNLLLGDCCIVECWVQLQ